MDSYYKVIYYQGKLTLFFHNDVIERITGIENLDEVEAYLAEWVTDPHLIPTYRDNMGRAEYDVWEDI